MKRITSLLAGTLTALGAVAGPLQPTQVADNAKWVLHLDVENLLTTQFGAFVEREFLEKKLSKPVGKLEEQFGIAFNWRDVKSITAYGTDFKKTTQGEGVLMIKSTFDFASALNSVIEKLEAIGAVSPLEKFQSDAQLIYSAKNEVFGAPVGKDVFLVSKSQSQLEQALSVLAGKSPNLTAAKSFPSMNNAPSGFLTAAVADGFQTAAKLPPQANGLKNAESGRIVAGEKADKVFVNLSLNTRDSESATQIQQVLQGLLAFAVLTQQENKDLATLVQGATVGGADKMVTLNLEVPCEAVIAKVSEKKSKRRK